MNPILLIGTLLWLYVLSVLKRTQLPAYFFIVGSVGLFFILLALSKPYWVWFATHLVILAIKGFSTLTQFSDVMVKYGVVHIFTADQSSVMMTIDYECSGIIETTAFWGLVAFFPAYSRHERLLYMFIGWLWIYLANVLRLIFIIVVVHFGGYQAFFLAHNLLGRLIFYIIVIMLYYNVFTYSQLAQKLLTKWPFNFSRKQVTRR